VLGKARKPKMYRREYEMFSILVERITGTGLIIQNANFAVT